MAKRDRIAGDDRELAERGPWQLDDILDLRKNKSNFKSEIEMVESAPAPFYESRNVQGE